MFLDADDTILNSSETIIGILNEKYNINPPKRYMDLWDWDYKTIYPHLISEEVEQMFGSDEFFNRVKIEEKFLKFYEANKEYIDITIVTKGNSENLAKKEAMFAKIWPEAKFCGMNLDFANLDYDKSSIDMTEGIQIDDRFDALETTNAGCKILILHYKDLYWNRQTSNVENLYKVNNWDEIIQILEFALHHKSVTQILEA